MSDIKLANVLSNDIEFNNITKDILNDRDFIKIKNISQHYITDRLTHCMKVSYCSYSMAKRFNIDYISAARSGLLHDYYYEVPSEQKKKKNKRNVNFFENPKKAIENSAKKYSLSEQEINAIESHMFPITTKYPKYKISWVVTLADKIVSICECFNRYEYIMVFALVFFINWLMD